MKAKQTEGSTLHILVVTVEDSQIQDDGSIKALLNEVHLSCPSLGEAKVRAAKILKNGMSVYDPGPGIRYVFYPVATIKRIMIADPSVSAEQDEAVPQPDTPEPETETQT